MFNTLDVNSGLLANAFFKLEDTSVAFLLLPDVRRLVAAKPITKSRTLLLAITLLLRANSLPALLFP